MGMDVYGKEPKNETGEYFRSNVWWWRRLWDFIFDIDKLFSEHFKVERLISEDLYQSGHCNDGAGLNSELDCKNLAKRVAWAIEEKLAEHREKEVNEELEQAKEENKFIEKQRKDFQAKMKKKLGKEVPPRDYPKSDYKEWQRIIHQENYTAHYPFTVEHLEEFNKFLKNCGGFAIH